MSQSSLTNSQDIVSFTLKLQGSELAGSYEVHSIDIDQQYNQIPWAEITILLPEQADDLAASSSEAFTPGSDVEIQLGYGDTKTTVFKGIITGNRLKIQSLSGPTLILSCQDKAIKLKPGIKTRAFTQQTDSVIIENIISQAGLEKAVDSTAYINPQLIQFQETDWDFVVKRAQANGLIVYAEAGKVLVKKPVSKDGPVLKVEYGLDIYEFDAEIDAASQLASVTYGGWDFKTQTLLSGVSTEPVVNRQGNLTGKKLSEVVGPVEETIQTTLPLPAKELKVNADAKLFNNRLERIRGRVSFQGSALAKVNTLIELVGCGARFNGPALISRVQHTLIDGNWKTMVDFGLAPDFYAAASGPFMQDLYPSIQGLQNALVTKLDEDPDGEHRVEVEVPAYGHTIWARIASFYATSGKGVFFLPEVGDEVVVGFMGNDPRFPIILGSLYSSKNAPAYTANEENSIKAFVTKADLKIALNDKDKIITINTPAGNEFVLSDQDKSITLTDQNGNKVEMSDAGISLKSAKDIKLDATGNVSIKAGQKIDLEASGGDLTLKGMNVNADGQVGAVIKGGASAELSAGGQTTVKGAMVMIN
jgi:Rhs element Vgr protein